MMSESVTVTVHDSQGGNTRHPGIKPSNAAGQPVILEGLALNVTYFKTLPGIVKILQVIFGIICISCGWGNWFQFVAVVCFIMSILWSLMYLFSIREALNLPINWVLTEMLNTGIDAILYFTAFVAELAWAHFASQVVAGIFGIFNTIAYGAGAYFLYLEYKNSLQ